MGAKDINILKGLGGHEGSTLISILPLLKPVRRGGSFQSSLPVAGRVQDRLSRYSASTFFLAHSVFRRNLRLLLMLGLS